MIFPHDNPETAALELRFGPESRTFTATARTAHLRDLVRSGDLSPITAVKRTFGAQLTAISVLELVSFFDGEITHALVGEPPELDGFYRASGDTTLFHPDSADYEEAAAELGDAADALCGRMLSSNVTIAQAAAVRPLSSGAAVLATGSVIDFYNLYTRTANGRGTLHPATMRFVADCWTELRVSYPFLTQVLREALPA